MRNALLSFTRAVAETGENNALIGEGLGPARSAENPAGLSEDILYAQVKRRYDEAYEKFAKYLLRRTQPPKIRKQPMCL